MILICYFYLSIILLSATRLSETWESIINKVRVFLMLQRKVIFLAKINVWPLSIISLLTVVHSLQRYNHVFKNTHSLLLPTTVVLPTFPVKL